MLQCTSQANLELWMLSLDPYRKNQIERIEKVQKNAARYATNNYSFTRGSTKTNMEQLGWIPLSEQRAKCKVNTL